MHSLRAHGFPFFKFERAIVLTARQTETKFREGVFAACIPLIHRANLRHGLVAFIDKNQRIVG